MNEDDVITLSDKVELSVPELKRAMELIGTKLEVTDKHADEFVLSPAAKNFLELLLLRYENDKIMLSMQAAAGQISNQQEFVARAAECNTSSDLLRYLLATAENAAALKQSNYSGE